MDAAPLKVLFVCSRNQWRSPTAEKIFRRRSGLEVRSAGTSLRARKRVSARDLQWAQLVCVMEHKHAERLHADFGQALRGKSLVVLDIPDDYRFMDPELVVALERAVEGLF